MPFTESYSTCDENDSTHPPVIRQQGAPIFSHPRLQINWPDDRYIPYR